MYSYCTVMHIWKYIINYNMDLINYNNTATTHKYFLKQLHLLQRKMCINVYEDWFEE